MAANPITHLEIEAFCRLALVDLSAWSVGVIRRVDDAVLAAIRPPEDAPAETEADVNDPKAVRGLLSGIRDRLGARHAKPAR